LNSLFQDVLDGLYSSSSPENIKLFDYYNFDGKGWSWSQGGSDTPSKVQERIQMLMETEDGDMEYLNFCDGQFVVRNIAHFLEKDLEEVKQHQTELHVVAWQHGDLNAGNIVIDDNMNTWLIDFADTDRGHILKDAGKLEAEILYALTPLQTEEDLQQALLITAALGKVKDLGNALPEEIEGLTHPELLRAYATVRYLRSLIVSFVQPFRNAMQMDVLTLTCLSILDNGP